MTLTTMTGKSPFHMKRFPIIFLFSLLACVSCKPTVSFDFVKEIDFKRENGTNDYFYCQCNDSLFIGNPSHSKTIYIHDISSGKILNQMKIPVDQDIQCFHYSSDTSIYFFPKYSTQLFRYNKERNLIDTIVDLSINRLSELRRNGIEFGSSVEFMASPACPLIVNPPHYYISNITYPEDNKNEQFPLFHFIVNNDTTITDNNIGRFPDNYYEKGKTMFPFNTAVTYTINNKNQIIVSHFADHNLYIYDLDGSQSVRKCKSKFMRHLPDKIALSDISNDLLIQKRSNLTTYFGIIFDPYRDCYYRFVRFPDSKKKHNNLNSFSIMVLDSTFNTIGEQSFKDTPYMCIGALVTPQGLMLKKSDDYSGKTTFGLFKINGL